MAARCAYCGNELKPNSMYCGSCGQLASAPLAHPVATGVPRSSVTAPAPTATVSTPQRSFELVLSTGERYLVSGQAVLGRSPAPVDPAVQALPIDDTTKSVSRAHVRLRVVSGTLYVTDVGSANGSAIERVGRRTACPPDVEFELRAGDRLWLGEVACDVLLA